MKRYKKTLFILFALSTFSIKTFSQVTIGSSEKPAEGALLQLNNITGVTGGGANATKGLLLPRVKLISDTDNTNVANTISGAAGQTYDTAGHTGLWVYNVNDDPCPMVKSGPYIWNGEKWISLTPTKKSPLEAETATTVTDRQGNVYPIANFGEAGTWMTQNLRTTIQPGTTTSIPDGITDAYDVMAYVYPKADGAHISGPSAYWKPEYGLLYNWAAASNNDNCTTAPQVQTVIGEYNTHNPNIQGICPFGWHLPSDGEWNQLQKVLTQNASLYSDVPNGTWNGAWELMTSTRTGGIDSRVMKSKNRVKTIGNVDVPAATNGESNASTNNGFDVLLIGSAASGPGNTGYGERTDFWTSSVYQIPIFATYRNLTATSPDVFRAGLVKIWYYSVRCKKD